MSLTYFSCPPFHLKFPKPFTNSLEKTLALKQCNSWKRSQYVWSSSRHLINTVCPGLNCHTWRLLKKLTTCKVWIIISLTYFAFFVIQLKFQICIDYLVVLSKDKQLMKHLGQINNAIYNINWTMGQHCNMAY